jgi:hypothetical protein
MPFDLGHGCREIIKVTWVDMVLEKSRVVVEHHDVSVDSDARRKSEGLLAPPARSWYPAGSLQLDFVIKVLRVAVTVDDRIQKAGHCRPPLALPDPAVKRIADAFSKGPDEQLLQESRVNGSVICFV